MNLWPEEVVRLREGIWPRDAQDRWAVWLEGEELRCWHAWAGTCVFEAQVQLAEDGSGTVGVLDILDDPVLYSRARTELAELDRFEGLLRLALNPREGT